jgi:hypothetical protein
LKQFIHAERVGDFELHLSTLGDMLPYFHACGHHNYAKCGHIYIQVMREEIKKLSEGMQHFGELVLKPSLTLRIIGERKRFVDEGAFAVRRLDYEWGGIHSDLAIEQSVMAPSKRIGGISSGRGVTEAVIAKQTKITPIANSISLALRDFCNLDLGSSEQHKDLRDSRRAIDAKDLMTLVDAVRNAEPFLQREELISVTTGQVAQKEVDCHLVREKGQM